MIFLLYYCEEDESREEWSVFYTPCEAFTSQEKRDARQNELKKQNPYLEFHTHEVDVTE